MATQIATISDFALMNHDIERTLARIQENLDGERISQWDLPRIKVPAGGGQSWDVPTIHGDESMREIVGIPVYQTIMRSYWESPDPVVGTPPDCSSPDNQRGFGNPGGDCASCALAQFGSAANGSGQACKLHRMLFVLRQDDTIPTLVSLPPTSVKPWRNFLLQASNVGPYYGMAVSLGLEKKTSSGFTYSVVVPKLVQELTGEELEKATTYHRMFSELMAGSYGQRMAQHVAADEAAETVDL